MGRFTVRPAREIMTLLDFIKPESDAPRSLWSTKISNSQLAERVKALGTGLSLAGLTRESNVLILLNDGIEFLITELALASHSVPSLTLSSPSLLAPVLESHPPTAIIVEGGFLHHVLELIYDLNEFSHHFVVVVGETNEKVLAQASTRIRLERWTDIEARGNAASPINSPAPGPDDVLTVSFYQDANSQVQAVRLTHQNITAGVTAIRALLPASAPFSALDTIISAHSLSTAFGRTIAYTALYEGTSFATLESSKLFKSTTVEPSPAIVDVKSTRQLGLPPATLLFLKPTHLEAVVNAIVSNAKKSFIFPLAWRHKFAGILEGYITKESLWDRLVFDDARSTVFGEGAPSIRGVIISDGSVPASLLTPARIALSVPLVIAHTHPLVSAPILASHPQDVQTFAITSEKEPAHVGPPTINIEVKLVGVDDGAVEKGEEPAGVLHVRGPIVGNVVTLAEGVESEEAPKTEESWVSTGNHARVQTNGAFKAWTV
ncbi:acetyl-CoA synthetase-like protein [Multifurca ochricompacta]|uniref:Acetyl-CoA synthetase-like protein n=1 Tax=Multifurca ochricompacta TaxID=376703 RepID=A0AAD4M625_9AGAM|nr:acetyl-CoA synthetase-like protein [Multifurca ochricompacta]